MRSNCEDSVQVGDLVAEILDDPHGGEQFLKKFSSFIGPFHTCLPNLELQRHGSFLDGNNEQEQRKTGQCCRS